MLKNKKAIYILLPIVALIWGIIIVRIFSSINPDINTDYNTYKESPDEPLEIKKDTFEIIANYRDPFLGRIVDQNNKHFSQPSNINKNNKPIVKETVIFNDPVLLLPNMSYKGTIINKKDNSSLAILLFQGKKTLLRKGESYKGVKILAIYSDSIHLEFNNLKYSIKK